MNFVQRITGKEGRVWLVLSALAPIAYCLGGLLIFRYDTERQLGVAISRQDAEKISREFALGKGIDTAGWKTAANLEPDQPYRFYLTRLVPSEAARLRALAPEVVYRFVLARPDYKENFEVRMAPSGRVIGFKRFIPRDAKIADLGEQKGFVLATTSLVAHHGRNEASRFQFSGSKTDNEEGSVLRTYTWRKVIPDHPALTVESRVVLQGSSPIAITTVPSLATTWRSKFLPLSPSLPLIKSFILLPLALIGIGWVLYRMVIRAREKEIPWKRTMLLVAIVGVSLVLNYLLQEQSWFLATAGAEHVGHSHSPGGVGDVMQGLLVILLLVGVLSLAWGSLEGDVRESFPDKLRSFDALLGGALTTRTVTVSVILGFILGGGGLLLKGVASWILSASRGWEQIVFTNEIFVLKHPVVSLFAGAIAGFPMTMLLIFIPLSIGRRWTRRPMVLFTFVAVTVLIVASVGAFGNYWPLWQTLLGTALLLAYTVVVFAVADILAAAVASTVASWSAVAIAYLAQPSSSLERTGLMLLLVLASVLIYSIIGAMRGREISLDVLRPEYVRNITDRIAVQAEIETARNAQKSFLPRSIPAIEKGSLAARCRAAYEVNGDYYDFFSLPNGNLAIAVADARTGGLHAALSTAMMKGMLLSYIRRYEDPRQIAGKVRDHLSSLFGDTLPVSFLFGIFDPKSSFIEFARTGASPRVFQLSDGRVLKLIAPAPPTPSSPIDIEEGKLAIGNGESLLFMTAGIVEALGSNLASDKFNRSATAEDVIDRLFRTAEQNTAEIERNGDWTAIVISRNA